MSKLTHRLLAVACILAFILIVALAPAIGQSAGEGGTPAVAAETALVSEFDVNGLKVLIRKRPNAKTVSGGLFIRGGARNITAKNAGIENFALSVAVEASKNYPRDVLRRELAKTGSSLGAGSSNDYSVVNFATTSKDFKSTWKAFGDVIVNPTFAPADVERVRQLILTALRNREDDPDNYLDAFEERIIYAAHPYSNDVNGTPQTVAALKAGDLKKYHASLLETSRLLLVIVGNVDPAEVKAGVKSAFGKLRVGSYKEKAYPKLDFSKPTLDVSSRPLPTNYIRGVFNAPSIDQAEYYPMRVAVTILRNRLFEEIRQKRSLSYAPSASMDTFSANTAEIYVTAVDANRTVSLMLDEIKRLRRQPVTTYEIESVAGGFLTQYFLDHETNAAQAVELAKYELIGGGWENSFGFLDRIRAVTPKAVQEVSQKYMKNLRFVVVGNPVAVEKSIFVQRLEETEAP